MNHSLSVIVTVHNKAEYISRCVNSILGQTYRNLELILVDDGSADGSGALCDKFAEDDSRVRVIHQARRGVVSARLAGTDAAVGAYIHHVDGDDWLDPGMEAVLMNAVKSSDADMAFTGYFDDRTDEHRAWPAGSVPPGVYDREAMERDIFPCMMRSTGEGTQGLYSSLWTNVSRKSLLAPILRGVDPLIQRGEDALTMYQAVSMSRRIVVTEGSYYHYSANPASVTARMLPTHFTSLRRLMDGYMSAPMARIPSILRQYPNKFLYQQLHGDLLARQAGRRYCDEELRVRDQIIMRIEALERYMDLMDYNLDWSVAHA